MLPYAFSMEMAIRICADIAEGKSLRTICKQEGMPARSTVFLWLAREPKFVELYSMAVDQRAELYAEEIMEIADRPETDNGEVQRDRLRVDARKWIASKLKPKKYGDKVELSGRIGHSYDDHVLSLINGEAGDTASAEQVTH